MDIRIKIFKFSLQQAFLDRGIKGKLFAPQIVSYSVTNTCNFRCIHCHASAGEAMPKELTMEEARKAVNEMAELGTEVIIFSGGEPLLRKSFTLNLTRYCIDLGIMPVILTNGSLLDYKTAQELKDAGILAVGIPLDYATPQRFNRLRNTPGAFESVIRAIKACHKADLPVAATIMLFKDSLNEMPMLMDLLSALDVEQAVLYDFIPVGRGTKVSDLVMENEQRIKLLDYLFRIQAEKEIFFLVSGGSPLYPGIILEMHKKYGIKAPSRLLKNFLIQSKVGCPAGIQYLSLRPNGDVYPCPFLQIKIGNIREQSLSDIWYSSEILANLRNRRLLEGKCNKCIHREICGGCRAKAWLKEGNYLASDPNCPIDLFKRKRVDPTTINYVSICVG
ncbi:MAG: radical SAM protein [Candidatus Bathyarchaeia archaeon]